MYLNESVLTCTLFFNKAYKCIKTIALKKCPKKQFTDFFFNLDLSNNVNINNEISIWLVIITACKRKKNITYQIRSKPLIFCWAYQTTIYIVTCQEIGGATKNKYTNENLTTLLILIILTFSSKGIINIRW